MGKWRHREATNTSNNHPAGKRPGVHSQLSDSKVRFLDLSATLLPLASQEEPQEVQTIRPIGQQEQVRGNGGGAGIAQAPRDCFHSL